MTDCKECKMNFSKTSNLRAHVRRKHPDKLETLAPKIKYSHRNQTCKECNANFVNFGNLRVHIKRKHPGKLDELAPVNNTDFKCKHCQKKFQMAKNLTLHNKVCTAYKKVKCPLCEFTNPTSNMINHYIEMHALQIDFETLEFESFEAFKEWKIQIENITFASFISLHGSRQVKNGIRKIKYTCHRSGVMEKKGKNIRALKRQGSNKINAYCPAEMAVEICTGKCLVKFCKSHVGHRQDQDLRHLLLSNSDRQFIAAKIASNVPFPAILDDIRGSISSCHLERLHLLTKKDLYNIEKTFNLNKSSSCEEDKLREKQENLIQKHQQEILGATSMEELEAVEIIMLPIKTTLEAIRRNSKETNISFLPSTSHVPDKKIIEPQRRLLKQKKNYLK